MGEHAPDVVGAGAAVPGADRPGATVGENGLDGRIRRWLAGCRPELSDLRITSLSRPDAGLSHDTVVVGFEARSAAGPVSERLVLRLAPDVSPLPEYDIGREAALQSHLADAGVPVAHPVVSVDAGELGPRAGMAMPYVAGHVIADAPALDPWLAGCSPEVRGNLHANFVSVLSGIHTVDLDPTGCGVRPYLGLGAEVDWWRQALQPGADGRPIRPLVEAFGWCARHLPEDAAPPSVIWGDVRLGNAVFDDGGAVRAVLDWDMAGVGPAELDLGYYLALDRAAGRWGTGGLEGFLTHDAVVARWEEGVGRPARSLEWYELFGLCRSLVVSNRVCRLARDAGRAYPLADDDSNPVLRHLVRRIGTAVERGGRGAPG